MLNRPTFLQPGNHAAQIKRAASYSRTEEAADVSVFDAGIAVFGSTFVATPHTLIEA